MSSAETSYAGRQVSPAELSWTQLLGPMPSSAAAAHQPGHRFQCGEVGRAQLRGVAGVQPAGGGERVSCWLQLQARGQAQAACNRIPAPA